MKTRLLLLILLGACGPSRDMEGRPVVRMFGVTPLFSSVYEELSAEVNELVGYELMGYSDAPDAGVIVVNYDKVTDGGKHPTRIAGALWPNIYVRNDSKAVSYDADFKLILTHEIGHLLMGREHSDNEEDLMFPTINDSCYKREAVCLVEALRDAGLLQ